MRSHLISRNKNPPVILRAFHAIYFEVAFIIGPSIIRAMTCLCSFFFVNTVYNDVIQWWILGEANEAVTSAPTQKYLIKAHFAVDVILKIIMKLGRKVGNRSPIRSEDLFFRDHYDFGRKKRITRSKPYFLENIKFWKSFPWAPNFEYLPLM